jgi:ubiquinone/menaquinone biosynthesis C-methylase UbiE
MSRTRNFVIGGAALGGLAGIVTWVARERGDPSACPYGQRWFLDLPRPFLRRGTLRDLLDPFPGERVLEVGPGTGYYSLDVAPYLVPEGQLDVVDLQQPMLDALMQRAAARGIRGIVPTHGDARLLPFPEATFDAAFMVATLGEVPSRDLALRELRRVMKPDGRVVIGEGQPDPHMVPLDELRRRAEAAGFRVEREVGGGIGYMALLRVKGG